MKALAIHRVEHLRVRHNSMASLQEVHELHQRGALLEAEVRAPCRVKVGRKVEGQARHTSRAIMR